MYLLNHGHPAKFMRALGSNIITCSSPCVFSTLYVSYKFTTVSSCMRFTIMLSTFNLLSLQMLYVHATHLGKYFLLCSCSLFYFLIDLNQIGHILTWIGNVLYKIHLLYHFVIAVFLCDYKNDGYLILYNILFLENLVSLYWIPFYSLPLDFFS